MDLINNNARQQPSSVSQNTYTGGTGNVSPSTSNKVSTDGLKQGDTIKGQVTNINNNQVTIRLSNNSSFTAKLSPGTEQAINLGMEAVFEVENVSPTELYLKLKTSQYQFSQDITVDKALEEAGLPKNIKNMEIVKELLNHGLSINKQSITNILGLSYNHKNIDINTLILMLKHNLPMTDSNIQQFQSYLNQEHQILNNIKQIADELPNLLNSSMNNNMEELLKINNTLLNFNDSNHILSNSTAHLSHDEQQQLILCLKEAGALTHALETSIKENTADLMELVTIIQKNGTSNNISSITDNGLLLENNKKEINLGAPVIKSILNQHVEFMEQQVFLKDLLNESQRETLSQLLKEFPISKEALDLIRKGFITNEDFMSMAGTDLSSVQEEQIRNLLVSKEYHILLKDRLLDGFTTTPEQLAKEKNINEIYQNIHQRLSDAEKLLLSLNHSSANNEIGLMNHTGNMRDNLNFMNQLNQMFTYFQLPLKFKDQMVHSELYIYTKKKDLKSNSNNLTVLLHLDMEHLKSLDIHISLVHNQINAKFYMEDKDAMEIILEHISLLDDNLTHMGYQFHSETLIRTEQSNLVKELIEKDQPTTPVKRYGFDIRA